MPPGEGWDGWLGLDVLVVANLSEYSVPVPHFDPCAVSCVSAAYISLGGDPKPMCHSNLRLCRRHCMQVVSVLECRHVANTRVR